jgi:hypothetical protein
MSTVQRVNFEPVTDINPVHRRDFPLTDPTLADPFNAVCLVDGEWMTLDNTGATLGKLIRACDITSTGNAATQYSFPLFAERGRYDVQANSSRKTPILMLGQYEFNTRIFDASAGTAMTAILQPLKVFSVAIGARNYSGLVGSSYTANDLIVGYITRLPSSNGGKLRFMSAWAVRNGST